MKRAKEYVEKAIKEYTRLVQNHMNAILEKRDLIAKDNLDFADYEDLDCVNEELRTIIRQRRTIERIFSLEDRAIMRIDERCWLMSTMTELEKLIELAFL